MVRHLKKRSKLVHAVIESMNGVDGRAVAHGPAPLVDDASAGLDEHAVMAADH
jgi:hypothetical protein